MRECGKVYLLNNLQCIQMFLLLTRKVGNKGLIRSFGWITVRDDGDGAVNKKGSSAGVCAALQLLDN